MESTFLVIILTAIIALIVVLASEPKKEKRSVKERLVGAKIRTYQESVNASIERVLQELEHTDMLGKSAIVSIVDANYSQEVCDLLNKEAGRVLFFIENETCIMIDVHEYKRMRGEL